GEHHHGGFGDLDDDLELAVGMVGHGLDLNRSEPRAAAAQPAGSCRAASAAGRAASTSRRQFRTRAMLRSAFSGTPPREIRAMNSSRLVVISRDALISSWIA